MRFFCPHRTADFGWLHMRLCSEPDKSADDIYERLKYKKMPFRKIKIKKSGAIDKPCGESVRRQTQKHVAKRYMIAEKLLSLHHESYQQYKYV